MVMGLILNGAKAEDEYCKALLPHKEEMSMDHMNAERNSIIGGTDCICGM